MAKKPKVTEKEKSDLFEAAQACPGGEAQDVQKKLAEWGGRKLSLSYVQKKLAEWRAKGKLSRPDATKPKEERRVLALDDPWRLGAVAQFGIALEAINDILEVWKHCVLQGRPFTIQQAIWAARLRNILSTKEPKEVYEGAERLYEWASLYAGRERAAKALEQQIDTRDLDALLVFDGEVYQAAVETGAVPPWSLRERLKALFYGAPELLREEVIRLRPGFKDLTYGEVFPALDYRTLSEEKVAQPSSVDAALEEEMRKQEALKAAFEEELRKQEALKAAYDIAKLWHTAFTKTARWPLLSREAKISASKKLASEVHAHFESLLRSLREVPSFGKRAWRPSKELLREVGYEE